MFIIIDFNLSQITRESRLESIAGSQVWRLFLFFIFLSQYEMEVVLCEVCLAPALRIEALMSHVVMQTAGHVQPTLVFPLDLSISPKQGARGVMPLSVWPVENAVCRPHSAGHFGLSFLGLSLSGPIKVEREAGHSVATKNCHRATGTLN